MDDNLYSTDGFYWWIGVVEDRNDPLELGRCRIRIVGYHTKNKAELPTEDLPWALPVQPITSAGVSGIGTTPLGPVPGSWVVGFFSDGEESQHPIFIGTFSGIPQSDFIDSLGNQGFQDPQKVYPKRNLLDEPDTNRLARNSGISDTIVQKKNDTRDLSVPTSLGNTWDEPQSSYSAVYPFNHVTETESGHIIEIDDTPGSERIHIYHKTGTFVEIDQNGSITKKVKGNEYQIIEANEFIHIKGKTNITIDGSCNVYVLNNCNLQVDGDLTAISHGNVTVDAGKSMTLTSQSGMDVYTPGILNLVGDSGINIVSKGIITEQSDVKTVNTSPYVESGITKMSSFSILPVIPDRISIDTPNLVDSKNPIENIIQVSSFTLTQEDRNEFEAEKIIAQLTAPNDITAAEYVSLKTNELDSNERASISTTKDIIPNADCQTGLNVVNYALSDVGIIETGTTPNGAGLNYGGLKGTPNGELQQIGVSGRIDEMLANTGLDNQAQVAATGSGYYWCAAAVTTWWKQAGLPLPPNPASVRSWSVWGQKLGLYSSTPQVGSVILYGPKGSEDHMGIVAEIQSDGTIITIEGNTSGAGYTRNGVGCFKKIANANIEKAFISIPSSQCNPLPPSNTITSTCVSQEMQTYLGSLQGYIPQYVIDQLPDVICKFSINTPLRMAHFLSQCSEESQNFTAVRENLNYSSNALQTVFKKYFSTKELADQYARNPEKIGNRVYANRMGNGDELSGDGYLYRGRGYIQLTGKNNYEAFRKYVSDDVVAEPDLIASKYPLLSAAWFWSSNNLNNQADGGSTTTVVASITRTINGGLNGLTERQQAFNIFYSLA